MFVYRKIDESKNKTFQTFEELPEHLKELVKFEKSNKSQRIGHEKSEKLHGAVGAGKY